MRITKQWNENWEFCKNEESHINDWNIVTLPHTWNNIDGQDGGNDYYQGIAWYRKSLLKEDGWNEVYIRFGAVSKKAEVWCNGAFVGSHEGGFSAFTLELTDFLNDGENEILVKADNSSELPIYPMFADFTFFGGIYRDVELIVFDSPVHFNVNKFGIDAIFITPEKSGKVMIDTYVHSGTKVLAEILDANSEFVAQSEIINVDPLHDSEEVVRLSVQVPEVKKWNGLTDPYLYKVRLYLSEQDVEDIICANFGFRDYEISSSEGFFLNEEHYPLRGVCRHQDREDMGWAITEKEHIEDMALIREIGANTIRLAHYQQAPFIYDLCDRNGMVVWAEIPFISSHDERVEANDNLKSQMKELILQNYNHPSICFWGIANEVGIGKESDKLYQILMELNTLSKELDPTRMTVIANVGMTETSSQLFNITDLTAYNEYKGWYEGSMDDHGSFCDEKHSEIPNIPLAISEYGAEAIMSWHSETPKLKDYTEEYQALIHEKAELAFEKRPYLWATWLWNMFDFAADARDEGGCRGRNNKGLVTYDRKIKKQAFYLYKACWSKEPFVYLCGKRYTKRSSDQMPIKVYSNQKRVDLWVNGVHKQSLDGGIIFEFNEIQLSRKYNEILVRTPEGLEDVLIIEKVDEIPEEYIFVEKKNLAKGVEQWFANIEADTDSGELLREIVVKDGYLSVNDSMEEIYRYPEGYKAVQELIAEPLRIEHPTMADRMSTGSLMTFAGIWNHIRKHLPEDLYFMLNERLNNIEK